MATIAAATELQPTDRRRSQNAANNRGRDATPQEEVLMRITSVPGIRRDKVLDIRRQLTEGTYEVADRLDRAIDRVLEAITT
jgi:anti-sigma28 factor (negative regulator of flagellin synthesis)